MWPVILRELRASSRRWTTYWLRLLAGFAVVMTIAWWASSPASLMMRQPGRQVFLQMHRVILVAIFLIVPLITADCLSREKREGTLGLLFLTNLRAWNIVFAKGVAAALTALTLWLSVIPVITVPVLLGGLPASEIFLSCSLALASIWWALAAGLLASSVGRSASQAVAMALSLSGIGLYVLMCIVALIEYFSPTRGTNVPFNGLWLRAAFSGVWIVWNLHTVPFWGGAGRMMGVAAPFNGAMLLIPLYSFVVSCAVAWFASWQLRRNWQDRPKTKRQTEVEKFFCAPVFWTGLFRWWMRRSLSSNPVGWLERRSWTGRISAWIALAIMISFASAFAYAPATRDDYESFDVLMWMLLIGMAYVAAASFQRERETGAMELILVTPLSERQIVSGRLRGLWNQFLPTFLIWVAVVLYLSSALHEWRWASVFRFTIAYLSVPVVGLYFSLRSRFVLLAWVTTLAVVFAAPYFLGMCVRFAAAVFGLLTDAPYFTDVGGRNGLAKMFPLVYHALGTLLRQPSIAAVPVQLAIAGLLFWRLHVNLRRRSFSFR